MQENLVKVPVGEVELEGDLQVSKSTKALVIFAHGSGSSRLSPRNKYVASVLQEAGLGTLLIDLLTKEEERKEMFTAHLRFDIPLLAKRLVKITEWLAEGPHKKLHIGYFGASTGAAAALVAAAEAGEKIKAVVSRGGRPDLAADALKKVRSPTLLIVGGNDGPVIGMNEEALKKLKCEKKLVIVQHASHLFEEKGTLEEVAKLAKEWFLDHLK